MPQADERVGHFVHQALGRLFDTLRHIDRYRDFARLLLCGVFYQAGVMVVIALAAIYAQEVMKFTFVQTMMLVLVVNVTAAIGAFAFGYVQDALGHKLALGLTLLMWLAMVTVAGLATSTAMFWVAANLAGLAMGSSQSAGRALAGLFAPQGPPRRVLRTMDFRHATGRDHRADHLWRGGLSRRTTTTGSAIGLTGLYFVAGLLALATIDIARGRRAAEASAALP